jgi:hypothetical protein
MRFTPFTFVGSQQLGTFNFDTPAGATTGTFSSGGVDYGYVKFTSGSYTLNVTTGAEIDMLIVGGGGGGRVDGTTVAGVGGGGGGVYYSEIRLYKGNYNVFVGAGGAQNITGISSSISSYGIYYSAEGGNNVGTSGLPQSNSPGANSGNCGGSNNTAGGGGGGASATGSSAFCPPSNKPDGANGGEGLSYNMDGTPSVYGSGGGGGSAANAFAQGGIGGTNAGNGASYNTTATNAVNGFGGGGGGERAGNPGQAGSGGHGIIILRYTT